MVAVLGGVVLIFINGTQLIHRHWLLDLAVLYIAFRFMSLKVIFRQVKSFKLCRLINDKLLLRSHLVLLWLLAQSLVPMASLACSIVVWIVFPLTQFVLLFFIQVLFLVVVGLFLVILSLFVVEGDGLHVLCSNGLLSHHSGVV